jgi:hypothetical protein
MIVHDASDKIRQAVETIGNASTALTPTAQDTEHQMAAEANLSLFRQHAAVSLAQQAAQRAVKRQIRSQGKIKLSAISAATLTRLGNDYLRSHPELLADAAADPIVQNL